ncbi:uncharacterized protein BDR25DRAFT_339316 [Lindgomyces ingoldianus]|uniref:Uncharacterized protein n=1 Tax=Lindgomyces ingoldianus TaxID=673940 RepID=A0ACB6RAU7_9PLEO|nr:uncharacterized protein BDR25DRAFT_339316 [Lindgomyces ingoldianus]KAF2476222.1 hypothetical protein BDR25DRAFT_339316 [Lindgomyces ingoldianus]
MAEDFAFIIDLEYDPVKNQELGAAFSKERSSTTTRLEDIINIQAGSETGGRSYLSIIPTTIQIVKPDHTLFIWRAAFHPGTGRRFTSLVISCKFSTAGAASTPQPQNQSTAKGPPLKVIAHAPRKSFGGTSRETKKTAWGLELPIMFTGAGVVEVGVTPTTNHEKKREVEHAFTITGTARGAPNKHTCVWTVEENNSTERGIPSEIQLATLIHHTSPVQCDVTVSGRVSGGILPPHYLKAKTAPEDRRKVIDPAAFIGLLCEYEFNGDPEGCDRLLKDWTGEVEGSILEFKQPVTKA